MGADRQRRAYIGMIKHSHLDTLERQGEMEIITMKSTIEYKPRNFTGYAALMRNFEIAWEKGDYAAELVQLSRAVAKSIIKKLEDPQRKQATERAAVSNSGINPAMVALRNGIIADCALLDGMAVAQETACYIRINSKGNAVSEVADPAAVAIIDNAAAAVLSDGIDLVQAAAAALVDQARNHAAPADPAAVHAAALVKLDNAHAAAIAAAAEYAAIGATAAADQATAHAAAITAAAAMIDRSTGIDTINLVLDSVSVSVVTAWIETPYTIRRLKKRVYIKEESSVAWEDKEITPISAVYAAVREVVDKSRAMQTDPRNGYLYLEDMAKDDEAADPTAAALETIYRRLDKFADLGGYAATGHFDNHGNTTHCGNYTVNAGAVADYDGIIARLNLTERQAEIIRYRMRGYGYLAIGTALGVSHNAVINACKKIQKKAVEIGFSPAAVADRIAADQAHAHAHDNAAAILELLATAERLESTADPAADSAYFIAWDEAEKHGVTAAHINAVKKRAMWEVGCKLRAADRIAHADPAAADELYNAAYDIAEKYGITAAAMKRYF